MKNNDLNSLSPSESQMPVQAQPHRKPKAKAKIWILAAFGVIFAALIASAVIFILVPALKAKDISALPEPVMYSIDDEVFVILENGDLSLGEVDMLYPNTGTYNGVLCEGKYLYYLVDMDKETGEADLMRLDLSGSRRPKIIAEDVCSGWFSNDEKQLLYLTNMKEGAGTLYLLDLETGEEEKIARKVIPDFNYGFSYNGEHIHYVCQTKKDDMYLYEVYMKAKGEESYKVNECIGENYDQFFFFFDHLDNGVLIHRIASLRIDDMLEKTPFPLYKSEPDGDTTVIAVDGFSRVEFEDSFTYYIDEDYYYVSEDGDEKKLSEKYGFAWNVFDKNGEPVQDRFLLGETDDPDSKVYTMYEQFLDGSRTEIGQTDSDFPEYNDGFTFIAYKKDGSLYVSMKEGDSWTKPDRIGKYVFGNFRFNKDETVLYYLSGSDENSDTGTLYRYSFDTEIKDKLKSNVEHFYLYGDMVYTKTEDELCWVKNEDEDFEIMDDVYKTYEGLNGVYIITESNNFDIYYLPYGETEPVLMHEGVDVCSSISGYIQYEMPIPQDAKDALDDLYSDAEIIIDILNGDEDSVLPNTDYTDSYELASKFMYRPDVDNLLRHVFSLYYYGFMYLDEMLEHYDNQDYENSDKYKDKSLDKLSSAIERQESYFETYPDL